MAQAPYSLMQLQNSAPNAVAQVESDGKDAAMSVTQLDGLADS
jgi:hypothetical protein